MSYDIYLLPKLPKGTKLSKEEKKKIKIPKSQKEFDEQKKQIKNILLKKEPDFQVFEDKNLLELSFEETQMQISVFRKEICVSIPYSSTLDLDDDKSAYEFYYF